MNQVPIALMLAAIAAALVWLALETRRVHEALDRYAVEMAQWQALVRSLEEWRKP